MFQRFLTLLVAALKVQFVRKMIFEFHAQPVRYWHLSWNETQKSKNLFFPQNVPLNKHIIFKCPGNVIKMMADIKAHR